VSSLRTIRTKIAFAADEARFVAAIAWAGFKPSVVQQAKREVAQHLRENQEFKNYSRSAAKRAASFAYFHPKIVWALLALSVVLALGAAFGPFKHDLWRFVHFRLLDSTASDDAVIAAIRDVCIALLAAQSALVTLTYPLVITIIGILFGSKNTAAARLVVFFRETEAVVTGGSALVLCGYLAVVVFFATMGSMHALLLLAALGFVWFIVNLVGLAFFLSRTLRYIQPAGRAGMVRAYLATEAWPAELFEGRAVNLLQGLLLRVNATNPGRKEAEKPWVQITGLYPSDLEDGKLPLSAGQFQRELRDVRGEVVALVASRWVKRATAATKPSTARTAKALGPHLFLPLVVRRVAGKGGDIARWSASSPLTATERFALRWAYRFGRARRSESPTAAEEVLKEVAADALAALAVGDDEEFEQRLLEMCGHHAALIRLAAQDDGTSLAEMANSTWWPSSMADDWAQAYSKIIEAAVAVLPARSEPLRRAARIPFYVFTRVESGATPVVMDRTFRLVTYMAWRMAKHALKLTDRVQDEGPAVAAIPMTVVTRDWYDDAWRTLIEAWERLLDQHVINLRDGERDIGWPELKGAWPHLAQHLSLSASMVTAAARIGDEAGGAWAIDQLLRWHAKLGRVRTRRWSYPGLREDDVPVSLLSRADWTAVAPSVPTYGHGVHYEPADVFNAASANAWADVQVGTVLALLGWAANSGPQSPSAVLSGRLVQRIPQDKSASLWEHCRVFESAATLMGALFRSMRDDGQITSFVLGQDRFSERMISGRGYSSSGMPDATAASALLLTMLCSKGSSVSCMAPYLPDTVPDEEELEGNRRTLHSLHELQGHVQRLHGGRNAALAATVLGMLEADAASAFDAWKECAAAVVQHWIDAVVARNETAWATARVSLERLDQFAREAEPGLTDPEQIKCPLTLFAEVTVSDTEEGAEFTVFDYGFRTGAFTAPRMEDAKSGEPYRKDVAYEVAVRALALIEGLPGSRVEVAAPDDWWAAVQAAVARLPSDAEPMLLMPDSGSLAGWLHDWQWPSGKSPPDGVALSRREERKRGGYQCHINAMPTYCLPSLRGACIVVNKSAFERATFFRHASGRALQPAFMVDVVNPCIGRLKLSAKMAATFAEGSKAHRIVLTEAADGQIK
jgi:hypothetical protein